MVLLRNLTLIYTAVLVSALGSSLVAVLVQLWRIAGALGEVREVLRDVRDETAPLGAHLQGVHEAVVGTSEGLGEVGARFARVDDGLGTLAPPAGLNHHPDTVRGRGGCHGPSWSSGRSD